MTSSKSRGQRSSKTIGKRRPARSESCLLLAINQTKRNNSKVLRIVDLAQFYADTRDHKKAARQCGRALQLQGYLSIRRLWLTRLLFADSLRQSGFVEQARNQLSAILHPEIRLVFPPSAKVIAEAQRLDGLIEEPKKKDIREVGWSSA